MGHIRKRGKFWYYYGYMNGKQFGVNLGVTSKHEAYKLENAWNLKLKGAKQATVEEKARLEDEFWQFREERKAAVRRARALDEELLAQETVQEDWLPEHITFDENGVAQVVDDRPDRVIWAEQAQRADEIHRRDEAIKRRTQNPTMDEFWFLGDKKEQDTGLFVEYCRAGHRSPNTLIAYRSAWKKFRSLIDVERMGDVTPEEVKAFVRRCEALKLSRSCTIQYVISMQGMYATAIKEGWFRGPTPFNEKWRQTRDKVAGYLSKDEVGRLLAAAKDIERNVYLFIAIAVHTGMRKDEVVNLRWEDIDFDRVMPPDNTPAPVVTLQAKRANKKKGIQEFRLKSNRARVIPLKSELVAILAPYRQPEGYIIQSVSGKVELKRSRYNLPAQFTEVTGKAKVECNPHLLRHTFASHAAIAGESIYKISKWLGHSTVQLTADTYAHLQEYDEGINRF